MLGPGQQKFIYEQGIRHITLNRVKIPSMFVQRSRTFTPAIYYSTAYYQGKVVKAWKVNPHKEALGVGEYITDNHKWTTIKQYKNEKIHK